METARMQEIKEAMRSLKNRKAVCLDEVTRNITKNRGDWVCNWLRRLCNKAFGSRTVSEDWKKPE